jgi:hypothetical protein
MTRLRSESGQVVPFVGIILLGTLLAICALAIDMGVWFKASRHAQGVADAAALAAVQDLPDIGAAKSAATDYARTNGGTLESDPTISTTDDPNDTITVTATETAPAIFARVLGIESETVHATATAQVDAASIIQQNDVGADGTGRPLPFAVPKSKAPTPGCDCFGEPITFCFGPQCAVSGGQFGTVSLDNDKGGLPPSTVADWITNGYPGDLGPGLYYGVPGNKAAPPAVSGAMAALAARHPTILLPVYDYTTGASGANMQYHVVGWAAFKIDSWDGGGPEQYINGSFQTLQTKTHGKNSEYFGVGHVKLTK